MLTLEFAFASRDATRSKLLAEIQSGESSRDQSLKVYSGIKDELSVYEGVILRGNRIVVPQSLRKQILKLAHETHQRIVKTKQFFRARFLLIEIWLPVTGYRFLKGRLYNIFMV